MKGKQRPRRKDYSKENSKNLTPARTCVQTMRTHVKALWLSDCARRIRSLDISNEVLTCISSTTGGRDTRKARKKGTDSKNKERERIGSNVRSLLKKK